MNKKFLVLLAILLINIANVGFAGDTVYCPPKVTCTTKQFNTCSTYASWELNSSESYLGESGTFPLVRVGANQVDGRWYVMCQYATPSAATARVIYHNKAQVILIPETPSDTDWYKSDRPSMKMCDEAHYAPYPPAVDPELCPLVREG